MILTPLYNAIGLTNIIIAWCNADVLRCKKRVKINLCIVQHSYIKIAKVTLPSAWLPVREVILVAERKGAANSDTPHHSLKNWRSFDDLQQKVDIAERWTPVSWLSCIHICRWSDNRILCQTLSNNLCYLFHNSSFVYMLKIIMYREIKMNVRNARGIILDGSHLASCITRYQMEIQSQMVKAMVKANSRISKGCKSLDDLQLQS